MQGEGKPFENIISKLENMDMRNKYSVKKRYQKYFFFT